MVPAPRQCRLSWDGEEPLHLALAMAVVSEAPSVVACELHVTTGWSPGMASGAAGPPSLGRRNSRHGTQNCPLSLL